MFYPSKDQTSILNYVKSKNDTDETVKADVIAPAGTGKSSTILYLMDNLSNNDILYLVYNTEMKKEMSQRINFSTSYFNMINKERLDIFTFHGFMRKTLNDKIKDIGFDYINGSCTSQHIATIAQANGTTINAKGLGVVADSFNLYIKEFVKDIQSLEDFISNPKNTPIYNENIAQSLMPIINDTKYITTEGFNKLSLDEKEKIITEVYNYFLESIYERDALKENMPHDIYYKYVYHKYQDLNLFDGFDYLFVDEAQDIDKIMIALLEKSDVNIIKFGDNFQQINRFRGTVSSIENKENKQFALTTSYRLTNHLANIVEGFLKQEGEKLGYDKEDIPHIYGTTKPIKIKDTTIKTMESSEFFSSLVEDVSKIRIDETDTYLEIKEEQERISATINKGCKTTFNKAVSRFLKEKDSATFYEAIIENTTYFNHDKVTQNRNKELYKMSSFGESGRELYNIAKNYNFKLSNKEKRELLVTSSGSYGFLARNNKKVISSVYELVQSIPQEKLGDIPLYNIKFQLSLATSFDNMSKNNLGAISSKEMAMLVDGLKKVNSKVIEKMSVWENYEKLREIKIPDKLLQTLINDSHKSYPLSEANFLVINGKKHSLEDYGVKGVDLQKIVDNAIKSSKTKLTKEDKNKEHTIEAILERFPLKTINELIPFDKLVRQNISIEEANGINSSLLKNYIKYTEIKEIAKYNPNIELVSDGAFYNIYCSTLHQSKGLEMDNVLLANDVYILDDDKSVEENRDELKLAYVGITRAKKTLALENGSALKPILDEVVANDNRKYFKGKELYLVEGLSKDGTGIPYHEVYYKNRYNLELFKSDTNYTKLGVLPSYKDIAILINTKQDEVIGVVNKNDIDKNNLEDEIEAVYVRPLLDTNDKQFDKIIKDWGTEVEAEKEEIENEAEFVF